MGVDPQRSQDAPRGFAETLRQFSRAQKSNHNVSAYARWVNRPAGRYAAVAAYRLGLRPNQVTVLSGLLSALGIVGIAVLRPTPVTGVLLGLCLVVAYVLDSADGQLARFTGGGSMLGEWLDHVIDAFKVSTLHLAVLVCMYRHFALGHTGWLLVPLAWSALSAILFFSLMLTDQFRRSHPRPAPAQGAEEAPFARQLVRSLVVLPIDYGFLCLVLALIGLHRTFLAAYTGLLVLFAGFVGAALLKWYRELTEADLRVRRERQGETA